MGSILPPSPSCPPGAFIPEPGGKEKEEGAFPSTWPIQDSESNQGL